MTTGEVEVPYLILHKVRGQPAFDIAVKVMIGDEEGWIIPTSGHRAYPIEAKPLAQRWCFETDRFKALPDHYGVKAEVRTNLRDLLAKIVKPVTSNFKKRAI